MKKISIAICTALLVSSSQANAQSGSRSYTPAPTRSSSISRASQAQTARLNEARLQLAKQRAEKERMAREARKQKNLAAAAAAKAAAPTAQVHMLEQSIQSTTEFLNKDYLVFGFDQSSASSQRLPLVIYLHGSGGRGDDVQKVKAQAETIVRGIKNSSAGPCLVVAPQCSKGTESKHGIWTTNDLDKFLSHLKQTLPIDESRIYLTGNSMGGYGTWLWASHHPQDFAAVAPVVGGLGSGGPKDISPDVKTWAKNLASVPVWAFAGEKDTVVPADRATRMVQAIQSSGGQNAKATVVPNEGHGAGRLVYDSKEFYDWMFSQKRG